MYWRKAVFPRLKSTIIQCKLESGENKIMITLVEYKIGAKMFNRWFKPNKSESRIKPEKLGFSIQHFENCEKLRHKMHVITLLRRALLFFLQSAPKRSESTKCKENERQFKNGVQLKNKIPQSFKFQVVVARQRSPLLQSSVQELRVTKFSLWTIL